uniref:ADP-ribosyl cyclase/cyclic ADP-ribose hydrolase n=1 Tax=Monodelphis domestica TaxID=13616 RepID=F6ZFG5_MONDO
MQELQFLGATGCKPHCREEILRARNSSMEPSKLVLLQLKLFLILLLGAAGVCMGAGEKLWKGLGTTPHLESIFRGRCNEFISLENPELGDKNCSEIWEAFKTVFHKDPCSVLPSDYDLFINLSRHPIPRDKSLFWENNYDVVTAYAQNGRRLLPITNMLYGRIVDLLDWCRKENSSELDYQSCPTTEDCENNAMDSFWKKASSQYAYDSSGVIYVMLNGSEPSGAYPVKGFFADYEIPNFQKDKVTRFVIWVMHEIGQPHIESCGEGSMKILENRLKEMEFKYECINDYRPVKLLKCLDYSTHPECVFTSAAESTQQRIPFLFGGGWGSSLAFLLFFFGINFRNSILTF